MSGVDKLLLYSGFLYFPEDKSAYLPAAIEMILIFIVCFILLLGFKKISKRQEMKTKELEQRILEERNKNQQKDI